MWEYLLQNLKICVNEVYLSGFFLSQLRHTKFDDTAHYSSPVITVAGLAPAGVTQLRRTRFYGIKKGLPLDNPFFVYRV